MLKKQLAFLAVSLVLVGSLITGAPIVSAPAFAQSSGDISNRLLRLENELQTLNRAVYRGDSAPQPQANAGPYTGRTASAPTGNAGAQAEIRIQELEGQIRALTGRIEQQNFQIRQMEQRFDRFSNDVELRLKNSGQSAQAQGFSNTTRSDAARLDSLRSETGATPTLNQGMKYTTNQPRITAIQPQKPDSETAPESFPRIERLNPQPALNQTLNQDRATQDYESAFALLKNGSHDRAEVAFTEFLTNNSNHSLAANAKYWLGETYYVRGKYQDAARSFAEGFQTYPDSSKTPDSLLKLGMSLAALGNNSDACTALQKLKEDYTDSATPVIRRADVEIAKLSCGA